MAASTLIAVSEWKYYVLSSCLGCKRSAWPFLSSLLSFIGNERDIGACSHLRLARS